MALALPLTMLGQTGEQQQTQEQSKETQTTVPAKEKKVRPEQEKTKQQAKPETGKTSETGTDVRGQTNVNASKTKAGTSSSSSTSNTTTVNKTEFRSRHSEVFSLGRHPKEFFIERFGERHFRLIGNAYFVFVDGCWVAVDVDGFVFAERVICAGDPDFVEVVD